MNPGDESLEPDDDELEGGGQHDLGDRIVEVQLEKGGERLDKALAALLPDLSRARLQALIAEGALSLEGRSLVSGSAKAQAGLYRLRIPAPAEAEPQPQGSAAHGPL